MTKTRNRKSATGSKPDATLQDSVAASTKTVVPRQTKAAILRTLLEAPGGASLTRIMTETGWQAHTVRAALTGLRKAGLHLTRRREGDDTIYAIGPAVQRTTEVTGEGDGEFADPDATRPAPIGDVSGYAAAKEGVAAAEASA